MKAEVWKGTDFSDVAEEDTNRKELQQPKEGYVGLFMRMLGMDNPVEDREEAVRALWRHSVGGIDCVNEIATFPGILTLLVSLLPSTRTASSEASTGLLRNISALDFHRTSVCCIRSSGGISWNFDLAHIDARGVKVLHWCHLSVFKNFCLYVYVFNHMLLITLLVIFLLLYMIGRPRGCRSMLEDSEEKKISHIYMWTCISGPVVLSWFDCLVWLLMTSLFDAHLTTACDLDMCCLLDMSPNALGMRIFSQLSRCGFAVYFVIGDLWRLAICGGLCCGALLLEFLSMDRRYHL